MAQSVEQLIRNQQVSGSSPLTSSIKKVQESCGFLDFFAFSELFFFLLEEQQKEGSKKGSPHSVGKNSTKGLSSPCVAQEGGCGCQLGVWTHRREQSPQNRKFSTCSKRVSIFDIFCVEPGATMKMAKANTIAFR